MTPNEQAFLDMIAVSELGPEVIRKSDNGYNVLVGSTPRAVLTFKSYAAHPNVYSKALNSTAAGRYQLLYRYWLAYSAQLKLPDFAPASQDRIALQQISECAARPSINAGRIEEAIKRCARIWASLPGAGYGQHEHELDYLVQEYERAGGTVA